MERNRWPIGGKANINLLLKINENVALKEEFETFQLINYYSKKEYIQQQNKYLLLFSMQ